MPLRHVLTHQKLFLGPVGSLCGLRQRSIFHTMASKLTIDGLLGAGKVNGLDTSRLLELGGNSGLGGSCDASASSAEGRDESASLRGGGQLARNLAGSTSDRS